MVVVVGSSDESATLAIVVVVVVLAMVVIAVNSTEKCSIGSTISTCSTGIVIEHCYLCSG